MWFWKLISVVVKDKLIRTEIEMQTQTCGWWCEEMAWKFVSGWNFNWRVLFVVIILIKFNSMQTLTQYFKDRWILFLLLHYCLLPTRQHYSSSTIRTISCLNKLPTLKLPNISQTYLLSPSSAARHAGCRQAVSSSPPSFRRNFCRWVYSFVLATDWSMSLCRGVGLLVGVSSPPSRETPQQCV